MAILLTSTANTSTNNQAGSTLLGHACFSKRMMVDPDDQNKAHIKMAEAVPSVVGSLLE
jgi:hypothetical protein